jgi:hypothetical protein
MSAGIIGLDEGTQEADRRERGQVAGLHDPIMASARSWVTVESRQIVCRSWTVGADTVTSC